MKAQRDKRAAFLLPNGNKEPATREQSSEDRVRKRVSSRGRAGVSMARVDFRIQLIGWTLLQAVYRQVDVVAVYCCEIWNYRRVYLKVIIICCVMWERFADSGFYLYRDTDFYAQLVN